MPLIEELPITQSHRVSHGWAYVPDTGLPAIAAVQPGNRKRGRDGTAAGYANATAKQQKAVQARLDSLDKENYKDGVSVPIPSRAGAEKKRDKKTTTNVRRILTSQRAFAHYLADEEALAAAGGDKPVAPPGPTIAGAGKVDGRKKASVSVNVNVNEGTAPTPTPARRGRPPSASKNKDKMPPPPKPRVKQEDKASDPDPEPEPEPDPDTIMSDAPPSSTAQQSVSTTLAKPTPPTKTSISTTSTSTVTSSIPIKPPYDPKLDAHPLLKTTGLPKMPSDRVMSLLLAEPPLSYTAARATHAPDSADKPVRRFCGVCGYWGKVKCRKCGEWTCGILECWRGHEGVCLAQGMF